MAIRLTVVVVHAPAASPTAGQVAEAVVGQLIGAPGIDVTLIGPLESISAGSTDRLSLESLDGDLAVLDWNPPQAIVQSLRSLGVDGHRSPHPGDPQADRVSSPGRRIFAFDLGRFGDAGEVCEVILGLRASRQVRTFSLLPTSDARPRSGPPATPSGGQSPEVPLTSPPPADRPVERPGPEKPPQTVGPGDAAESRSESDPIGGSPSRIDLDDLIDRLDDLDP